MRNCIGVRSCTSSITMCPNTRISSVSSIFPFLRGRGPNNASASSSNATSLSLHNTSAIELLRVRTRHSYSSAENSSLAADFTSAADPNKSCNNSAGTSIGQMRASVARNSGMSRNESRNVSTSASGLRLDAIIAEITSVSTKRCAALCRRKRRRASRTMRADSVARKRM